ncbi:M20 family metallopeptidase [Paenalcaligenes niemegkensis]|uniref:M20 family metallopeptidase n=1 Tax=Paenalcaligenes niemegkensis TaxID=2895469 RepID=UPI001EE923A2|nr:M20 family metallopeptidase [Paenalcaligenes niemegkensis]MCQ9618088.1 M20 family metallopeptidase [Paenalcaligenes niemegkensis]
MPDVHSEAALSILFNIRRWVECESPSHDRDALLRMADVLVADARGLGLQVNVQDIGGNTGPLLHFHNRAAGDTRSGIMLLAHYDTVHPVGTLKDSNPCRIEDDKFFGPGVYDMKAGTWLALAALGTLSQAGSSALPIDFLIVPDEEIGSHESRSHIETYATKAKYVLVCEPARAGGGRCVTARKGTGFIHVSTRGRPAHAGVQHQKGRNAIQEMAHQILALQAMTDYERGITVSVGSITGGTTTNVVPEHCHIVADFRVPDMDAITVLREKVDQLKSVDPDVALKVEFILNRPPMPRTEETAALLARAQIYAEEAGFMLEEAPMTGGGSDANFTAALGIPTLDGLGADGDGAHTLWEHILVSTLPQRLNFWQRLLRNLD